MAVTGATAGVPTTTNGEEATGAMASGANNAMAATGKGKGIVPPMGETEAKDPIPGPSDQNGRSGKSGPRDPMATGAVVPGWR